MITIFCMAFNEEVLIQYMIDHYRNNFPNCNIVLFNNDCTDNTIPIAKKNNCEIIHYPTNNQVDDFKLRELKNNCWKSSKTDWVLICDIDELLNINEKKLKHEEIIGTTIISSEGYNMVNMEDNFDLTNIKYGFRAYQYDKAYLFNKKYIKEINYCHGGHSCQPIGKIKFSDKKYKLYHYKYINPDYHVSRYKITADRLSQANIKCGMGLYYIDTPEHIRAAFESERLRVIKVIE